MIYNIDIFTEEFLQYWLTDNIEDHKVYYENSLIWCKNNNDLNIKLPITVAMTMNLDVLTFKDVINTTTVSTIQSIKETFNQKYGKL